MLAQAEENLRLELPLFIEQPTHNGTALIIAGGPSLAESLKDFRRHKARGGHVWALNGAFDWLRQRGIRADVHVLLDARPENRLFITPTKGTLYLIAAQCHPDIFRMLEGYEVYQFAAWLPGMEAVADKFPHKPITLLGGGETVGLKTMLLCFLWGYRKLRLFGMDSCYRDESGHAYAQPMNDTETVVEVERGGRKFRCALWMERQALQFAEQYKLLTSKGCAIHVHGQGLLSWITQEAAHA